MRRCKTLAQALTGELTWVSGRTRPDIGFAVGMTSRMLHRRPAYIVQVGYQVMRYLRGTTDLGLCYRPRQHLCGRIIRAP